MCILKGGSGSRWVDRLKVGVGYPVWGFRIEKKSPDFRSPEVGISAVTCKNFVPDQVVPTTDSKRDRNTNNKNDNNAARCKISKNAKYLFQPVTNKTQIV